MRLLVCGGRDFDDREFVYYTLDRVHAKKPVECLIHGSARGADTLAADWAIVRSVPIKSFPANWGRDGKGAGPIRNQRMLDEGKPDGVVAFAGGRGTADMIARAEGAGLPVYRA